MSFNKPSQIVEGVVERVVYENADTGFFVGRLREQGKHEQTTFVGNLMAVSPGETIRLRGHWVEDQKWGRQLRVSEYEILMPSSIDAIEKYLGSGLIQGIGPAFAKRMVETFGAETLRIIDEHPERLREVPGIGRKRALQIREAWAEQRAVQAIMLFLQSHGVGVAQAARIYKRYGDSAVAILRENPYRLASDIWGIGFRSADKIAASLGIAKDAPERIAAGILYVLDQAASDGHVFLPQDDVIIEQTTKLLEVAPATVEAPLKTLVMRRDAIVENGAVYLPRLYDAESGTDQCLKRIVGAKADAISIDVERAIHWVEKTHSIQLSDEQRAAIQAAAAAKVMVITGGPGTGKTTIIKSVLDIFTKKGLAPMLAAPTGRAARRMEDATGQAAKTIHRLLEFSPKEGHFLRDENNPLEADLIIIDESSMIDIQLMHSLLKAVPSNARLFFVGDVDQLPSVGPGSVLMDIIASGLVPVAWLKTIFRQAAESGIVTNAHRINQGLYPQFNNTDFFLIERKDPVKALETAIEVVTTRIPRKFGFDPIRDIQVLSPMHRGDAGVAKINESLQHALNPNGRPLPRRAFRLHDKVMQTRNNYELDVYNGDVGVITYIDEDTAELHVQFDDERVVLYTFDDLDDLTLAYAVTVHKSQGSEYPAVVMLLLPQHYLLLQRNLLYTGITRGKKLVVLIGDPKAISMATHNNRVTRRNTRLADRLRNINKS